MIHKMKRGLVISLVIVGLIVAFMLTILVINVTSKSVRYKSFYWFGWCPAGTSDKFDQSQNAFTPNAYIKRNNVCCATGNYGVVTKRGKNICCRNKFNCLDD